MKFYRPKINCKKQFCSGSESKKNPMNRIKSICLFGFDNMPVGLHTNSGWFHWTIRFALLLHTLVFLFLLLQIKKQKTKSRTNSLKLLFVCLVFATSCVLHFLPFAFLLCCFVVGVLCSIMFLAKNGILSALLNYERLHKLA